jgi:hypothetical protein
MHLSSPALACAVAALSLSLVPEASAQSLAEVSGAAARQRAAQHGRPAALREPEWIVGDIVAAIAQMRMRAEGTRGDAPGVQVVSTAVVPHARYDVSVTGHPRTVVEIADHLWAPEAFVEQARLGTASSCTPISPSPLVASLLNPTPDILLRENARVSARLLADMSCADAHQEAALLVAAFALREAAGDFSDPRRLMSRMTAHLAMADANGGAERADPRRLADLVLLTLAGRQVTALERIAAWETAGAGASVRSWLRALRLRNTFDWRIVPAPAQASPLERMALIRAFMTSTSGMQALDALDGETGIASTPDWARLILHDNRPGIEAGHRFSLFWIEAELLQAAKAFEVLRGGPPPPEDGPAPDTILAVLNEEPGPGPVTAKGGVEVLDWGTWAAAAQRHVLQAVVVRDTFLERLAVPQEVKEGRVGAPQRFGRLRLFPLVAMIDSSTKEDFPPAAVATANLVVSRPDLVTYWLWTCLLKKVPAGMLQPPPPDTAPWFAPYFLPGTAFDSERRPYSPTKEPRLKPSDIDFLHKRAPYSRALAYEASQVHGATLAAKQEMFGPLAEYDLGLIRDLARAAWSDEAVYINYMERAAQWDLDAYWDLAPYLADHGRGDEARDAYQHWFDLGRNRVIISNNMRWLVWQYFQRGEQARATEVAESAAGTYSATGLLTLADLHEWRGELAEAEALHRAIVERYETTIHDLLAFLLRTGRTGAEVGQLTAKVFPKGMARVTGASLSGAPADGVLVQGTGVIGAREGLKIGDVVVAVDGLLVQNANQYRVARGASADPIIRFTVWRDGQYVEVPARLRLGWVVSGIEDYKPAK